MPIRIQRKRTKGWRMPEGVVAVDRSTPFGNPFPVVKAKMISATPEKWVVGTWSGPAMWIVDSKEEALRISVTAFHSWINASAQSALLKKAEHFLRGKDLACWCPIGSPCHADVLLEIANR